MNLILTIYFNPLCPKYYHFQHKIIVKFIEILCNPFYIPRLRNSICYSSSEFEIVTFQVLSGHCASGYCMDNTALVGRPTRRQSHINNTPLQRDNSHE